MPEKQYMIIFEVEGGSDKGPDGHRRDSMPMIEAMRERGYDGEILFFSFDKMDEQLEYTVDKANIVLSRVNPGNEPHIDHYFQFLNRIADNGILVQTHPKVMGQINFKDILYKLKDTPLLTPDTYFYQTLDELKENFPQALEEGTRVLKQNFGSTGEGVWKVDMMEDGSIQCVEAVNNQSYEFENLDGFYDLVKDVFDEEPPEDAHFFKDKIGLVDVRYLPRIVEGELRVLFIGETPRYVVHKKPQEGGFSATLFSGAKYTYDDNMDNWKEVLEFTQDNLKYIKEYLAGERLPLIWTVDYILGEKDEDGNDTYVLSEVNTACVGFTSPKEILPIVSNYIAEELIEEVKTL